MRSSTTTTTEVILLVPVRHDPRWGHRRDRVLPDRAYIVARRAASALLCRPTRSPEAAARLFSVRSTQPLHAERVPWRSKTAAFLRVRRQLRERHGRRGTRRQLLEDGDGVFLAMLADIRASDTSRSTSRPTSTSDDSRRPAVHQCTGRGRSTRRPGSASCPTLKGAVSATHRAKLEAAGVIVQGLPAGEGIQRSRPADPPEALGRRRQRSDTPAASASTSAGWDARATRRNGTTAAVRVTGPVVAQMQAIFGEDWTFTTGEILAGRAVLPKARAGGLDARARR